MSDFEMQNMEAIDLVRDGQQLPRVACRFVPEVDYHRYKRLEREAEEATEQAELNAWKERVLRNAAAVGRAGCALIFVGAVAEGLMEPTFGMILTGACMVWSAVGLVWGRNRG